MAETIDDKIKEAPQASPLEKKEEKPKQVGTLESLFDETAHLASNTFKIGLAWAIPYGFASAVPSIARDTAILTAAQTASDYTTALQRGKKYTAGNSLESAVLGTATTPVLETMFRTTNSIPTNNLLGYIKKGTVWGGIMYPAFVGSYLPIAYLVRNRTFKGMGTYLKENYWKTLKDAWKYLLPFSVLNLLFAPAYLNIPIAAIISYIFDRFAAPPKGEIPEHLKKDKTPYLAAASSVIGKGFRNSYKIISEPLYAVGSGLRDTLYKSIPKPAPMPATSPAH